MKISSTWITVNQMHDCHKLSAIAKALEQVEGHFVIPVDGEELVVMRKDQFDKLKENKQEVQLELEATPSPEAEAEPDILEDNLDLQNQELAMQQDDIDYDIQEPESVLEEDQEELGAGPRTKVRFEPIKGDISPELQE